MPNESIGGISVSISVGLQDLQAQFEQAQQMADAAGKAMASAFNSSTGSLTQLGDAASGATQKVDSLSSSLSTAASGLTNAGLVFSALSAGIIGVGAASLEAAGKFEQWDVSFTRLLGSETAAKNMLEDLVNFAIKTPFEIPEVVNNAQRLMAFGFAAEQVIPTLTALGDAVAKMGRGGDSLNSLVLAFGEMSAKGVVQLRQLNMMTNQGVEAIKILADAYGVSTESMSASITKKLVPAAEAIPILLKGIEESSSGMMDKQSETFKGMASNLSDAMTKTFKAIGDTMLPLFKSLEQAAFSLLTFVQNLAEGFAKLPVSVQATALGVVGLVAAIGPLLLGLGALAFALKSLVELPAAITALGSAMGLMSTSTAAAGVAASVAAPAALDLAAAETVVVEATTAASFQLDLFQEELAAAAAEATVAGTQLTLLGEEIGAVAVTSAESGTAMAAAAAGGWTAMGIASTALMAGLAAIIGYKVGEWAYQQIPGLKALADQFTDYAFIMIPGYQAAMEKLLGVHLDLNRNMEGTGEAVATLQGQLATLGITVERGTMSEEEYIGALIKARDAHKELDTSASAATIALGKLQETYAGLESNLAKAQGVLSLAAAGMKDGSVSAGEYQLALKNVDDAQKKLNAGSKDYQDTLGGLTESYNKQEGTVDTLQNTIAQLLSIQNRTQAQDDILTEAENKLASAVKARAAAHGIATAAMQDQGKAYEGLVKSADQLMTKEIASSVAVSQAKAVLDQLTASTDTSAEHTRAVNDAVQQYGDAIKRAGGAMSDQIVVNVHGVDVLTTVGEALNKAKEAQGGFTTTMVNGVAVLKDGAQSYAKVGSAASDAAVSVGRYRAAVQGTSDDTSKAVNYNSSLAASINQVGVATADALSVNDAWNGSLSTSVDNTSKLANSINGVTAALHNMVTAADAAGTAAFDADKSFKATTGSVNALSVGVAFLAMQLSGLTAFAGSGINYAAGQSDLQHQLYLARQAAGDPTAQPANFTVATSGALKGQSFDSVDSLNQALADLAKNTAAAATSTEKLSNATAKLTQSTLQYVDGVGNIYDSYQEMIDAIAANPNLGGLTSTIDRLSTASNTANQATQAAANSTTKFVDGLGNLYDSMEALNAALAANPLLGGPVESSTGDKMSGPSTMPSTMVEALANMTKLATPIIATGEMKVPNVLGTFHGQPITGSPGMSLADAIAMMDIGVGSGSETDTALPGSMVTSNGTSNYTPVPSNQQGGTNGQGVVVNMHYPSFHSQQQADQVMKQVVTQLRTVTGLKL